MQQRGVYLGFLRHLTDGHAPEAVSREMILGCIEDALTHVGRRVVLGRTAASGAFLLYGFNDHRGSVVSAKRKRSRSAVSGPLTADRQSLTAHLPRQLDIESRPLPHCAVRPDPSAEPLDRLAHQRQADSRTRITVVAVQALEDLEDVVMKFHIETDAVVGARKDRKSVV